MGKTGLLAAALLLGLSVGCGGGDDRPDNISYDGGGGVGAGGTSGGGGSGGSSCQPIPGTGSTVTGKGLVIYDLTFNPDIVPPPFAGQAEIKAEGSPCGVVGTTWDGAAPPLDGWTLQDVYKSGFTPLHFYQAETSAEPVYPTLRSANTSGDLDIGTEGGFARSTDIDQAYTDAGVERNPERGTIVVQLVHQQLSQPAAGGVVTIPLDSQAVYRTGVGWQLATADSKTDPSGLMMLLNVEGEPFPGKSSAVTTTVGSQKQNDNVIIESGAVTVLRIGLAAGF